MIKQFKNGQKVNSSVKPLPFSLRKEPVLKIGWGYYVSFFDNNVYPCTLLEIINEFEKTEVKIEIPMKAQSRKGYLDSNGVRNNHWKQTHILYATEIGLTPEDAVRNQAG
ncbi:MAG TPA: hypothetical protein VFW07_27090 [Parafilimonas sp.]|nr:hypothetical protein [Parafilimonas sp.]